MEFFDFLRHDDAAPATVDLDVAGAALVEHLPHVFEELHVTTLVAGDRNTLRILLNGGGDDLLDAAIVAEMDHLCARRLQDTTHDVDRGVVAVKERGRRDDSDRIVLGVNLCLWHTYVGRLPSTEPRMGASSISL